MQEFYLHQTFTLAQQAVKNGNHPFGALSQNSLTASVKTSWDGWFSTLALNPVPCVPELSYGRE
jgi:hypothetical protein